ncbi:glycosyltransferase family 25 protein [Acidipropionibacterium jensenii]|uniref:glycosyltransferase family 25 protein n=1 Tax=Acidipropionibacterium jensenii TaxID=1749 RepID=UPI000BC34E47|nr:glycosyltransferase family 25 protein [Acidipropionibacterium jensenii]
MRSVKSESTISSRIVVSLAGSRRRDQTVPELLKHGFSIFDAVDGRAISTPGEVFDTDRFDKKYHRAPEPGEIGCTLSHLSVMRSFAEDSSCERRHWLVVAEDDAVLSPHFERDIERVLHRCSTLDMVMLASVAAPADVRWQDPVTSHTVISLVEPPVVSVWSRPFVRRVGFVNTEALYGTLLYAIKKPAAQRILSSIDGRPYFVADDWVEFSRMGLRIGLVRPNLAGPREDLSSEIRAGSNGDLWSGAAYEKGSLRERIRIRTRVRCLRETVAVSIDDLRGRI